MKGLKRNKKRNTKKTVKVIKSKGKEKIIISKDTVLSKSNFGATSRTFVSESGYEADRVDQDKSDMFGKSSRKEETPKKKKSTIYESRCYCSNA